MCLSSCVEIPDVSARSSSIWPATRSNSHVVSGSVQPASIIPDPGLAPVLAVDDDPVSAMVAAGMVEAMGRNAVTLSHGAEAVPVFALTANVGEAEHARCAEAGMNGFIAKPCSKEEFEATLGPVFAKRPA